MIRGITRNNAISLKSVGSLIERDPGSGDRERNPADTISK
jgi:hypothetical protein